MTEDSYLDTFKLPLIPRTREEKIVEDLLDSTRTFDFSTVRMSNAVTTTMRDEEGHTKATADLFKSMSKTIDKIMKNSLFGSTQGPKSKWVTMTESPIYTANLIHVEESDINDFAWRVKIRCPNFDQTGFTFPSESHACEDYARREVKPWVEANSAHETRHLNYAVFAFRDETDATLCYMRFR